MTEPMRAALRTQLTVSEAAAAARAGDLDEAARLLAGLDPDTADPIAVIVLDLRARVHAQRGELSEADRCWATVLELTPDDDAAAAGRRMVAKIVAGRRRHRPVLRAGRVAAAAAAAVVAVLAAGVVVFVVSGTDDVAQAAPMPVRTEPGRAAELEQRLRSLEAERAEAEQRLATQLDAIVAAMTMPGVVAERRVEDVRLVFDQGLFQSNAELTDDGAALLTEVGRRLASQDVDTTVVGHVVAVPGGRTSGGSTVALARAQVAAGHLGAGAGLPLTAFSLVSADQSEGPFAEPERNRTVTLVLTPKETSPASAPSSPGR